MWNTPADASKNVSAPFHTRTMAKKTASVSSPSQPVEVEYEYHVSYSDSQVGRVQVEELDDLAAAERFAAVQLRTEDSWAIVERVEVYSHLRLVA